MSVEQPHTINDPKTRKQPINTEFVSVLCVSVQFWNQKPWSQQYQPGYY